MKKKQSYLILTLLTAGALLAAVGCHNPLPPAPGLPPISTATVDQTPVCGFTAIPNNPYALTPQPSITQTVVVVPYTPTITPQPTSTPNVSYPNPPGAFTGPTTVLRNLAQFQSYFGAWVPPVDFNTQMVLAATLPIGCSITDEITGACEGPTQVTVDLTTVYPAPGGPHCNMQGWAVIPIAVPQSGLPVVWQVTEIINPP